MSLQEAIEDVLLEEGSCCGMLAVVFIMVAVLGILLLILKIGGSI